MNNAKSQITVRATSAGDTQELCNLLNKIIHVGGTTAFETPFTDGEFAERFLHNKNYLCGFVATDELGALAGFQIMWRHPDLPDNWADIATFARINPKTPGVGTALFAESRLFAKKSGMIAINATIRADNTGGLAYYGKMGFETYSVVKDKPLNDGTPVDRISKRIFIE